MQLDVAQDFNYQTFFMVTARQGGPVGVFIARRTVALDGTLPASQQPVLQKDELYRATPPLTETEHNTLLDIHFESDLVAFKPMLDVVVVRNASTRAAFGSLRIDRGSGFQPDLALDYGWLHRALSQDPPGTANPRKGLEGNASGFTPDTANKYKLPTGFSNSYFNGGRIRTLAHLQPGNRAEFDSNVVNVATRTVTIPARPNITMQKNGTAVSVSIDVNLDTVVYDESAAHFILVWRAVFTWTDDYLMNVLVVRN